METHPVYLNDEQRQELLAYYKNELKTVESRGRTIRDMITKLEASATKPMFPADPPQLSIIPRNNNESYNAKWPWTQKISFVLNVEQKCRSTREILDFIKENLEPELKNKKSEERALSSISGTISSKVKEGKVFDRYSEFEGGEWYIGLKEWFSTKNSPKVEFRH